MKIEFGVLVNNIEVLQNNLLKSPIEGKLHYILNPESATKGINKLFEQIDSDIFIMLHADVILPIFWENTVQTLLEQLPNDWGIAGIWGGILKDGFYDPRGRIGDLRFKDACPDGHFWKGKMPCEVITLDEVCLIFNMKTNFKFEEDLTGFDLYGTYACLKMKELGYKSYVIDNVLLHNSARSKKWKPDKLFKNNFEWLKKRFPNYYVLSIVGSENKNENGIHLNCE